MAELSAKEKLYAKHWGWKDNGDGTLTTPQGVKYDHEAGSNYSERTAFLPNGERMDTSNFIDVPTTKVQVNEDGVAEYTVIYSDGTVSYAGTGEEGKNEAMRARQRALSYNKYIGDNRTRADFATDEEYRNHTIVRDIRIGQGTYNYIREKNGNTKLLGPNGIVLQEGSDFNAVRKNMYDKANKYYMAKNILGKTDEPISQHLISYIKNRDGFTEQEAYQSIYKQYARRYETMGKIYAEWQQAAQEQGIELPEQYSVEVPTFDQFMSRMTFVEDPMSYSEWYRINVKGQQPAVTTGVTGTTVQPVTEQTITGNEGTTGGVDTVDGTTEVTQTFQPTVTTPIITTPTDTTQTPSNIYPTVTDTSTITTPLQTSGVSAIPPSVTTRNNYTGTTMQNLTSQSQQGFGGQRKFRNQFGQEITVTVDGAGNPITYVPPGYSLVQGQAEGGSVSEDGPDVQLARKFLGFTGPASQLTNFLAANPAAAARMGKYQQAMAGMAQNRVGAQEGVAGTSLEDFQGMQKSLVEQTMQPVQSSVDKITPDTADFIPTTAGQAVTTAPYAQSATLGTAAQVGTPELSDTSTVTPTTVASDVKDTTAGITAQTGTVSDQAQVEAAQQTTSSVSELKAEQGTAIMMDNPVQREIQDGELISGAANAEKAAEFTEQIEAATAEPSQKATVAGQLENLMQQFEGGNTPPWAAGSMRNAMAKLAARGLGASSMAGQAVIQAAMESALPIAQMDAQTQAQFESQNLSNRQQRAMLAAQQRAQFLGQEFDQAFQARVQNSARIGDIANMNFTAEQNIALENSRAANTMNLQNLSNKQAMVMAEAAALANMDMANLSNRQQAAVQNAQSFLQMDMANLSNEQQTAMFKAQQNIQALFTDQAAENAAAQFNATSENQTNQFFANLTSQVGQFNASQQNAMDQFNINSTNAMRQFNSEMQQQRDLFNAQNGLVVAQANAQWRQNIATLNNAAQNESNMDFAKTINALTSTNLDQIWQRERDIMSYAFTAQQSALDRSLNLLLGDKKLEQVETQLAARKSEASSELLFRFFFGSDPDGMFGGIFK